MSDALRCVWCSRTEAGHDADGVYGHEFTPRCLSTETTGRGIPIVCQQQAGHAGNHANGTRRWCAA